MLSPNPFAALDAAVSEVVNDVFGSRAIIIPFRAPVSQYAMATEDPTRPPAEVVGVFSSGPAIDGIGGQGRAGASTGPTLIAGQSLVFWISAQTVGALPYAVRTGDRLRFPDAPIARRYRISSIRPTDMADLELNLTEDPTA